MDIQIRKLENKDEQELKELILQFKKYEAGYEEAFRIDEAAVEELYQEEMVGEGKNVYVAETGDELVGFIAFEKSSKNDPLITNHVDCIYIGALYINPDQRKQGLGKKFMKIAEEYAKKEGIKFIKLVLFTKNKLARDFYFKDGFDDYESTMIKELQ